MRISHLYKSYLPHPGGVERAMHALASACAARGDDVRAIVCAEGPRTRRIRMDGVDVLALARAAEIWSMPLAPGYLVLPAREGEVLHVHESFPLGTMAALLRVARRPAAQVVVTWHFDVVRQRALAPLHRLVASRLLLRARAIHVTSDLLARRSPTLRAFAGKIRVIPHIVEVERFRRRPGHPVARTIQSWAAEAPVALAVGRLVYYKGIDVLLGALARTPDARLVVVGDGPQRTELGRRAARLGVAERVLWLGVIGDDDLVGAYSAADVLVLPSTAPTETFGVVQVEAMAAGVPVISTALGTGVERVNLDGVTGRVVAPRDEAALAGALGEVLGDAAWRARLSAAALERSDEFSRERLLDRYLELYADAAS